MRIVTRTIGVRSILQPIGRLLPFRKRLACNGREADVSTLAVPPDVEADLYALFDERWYLEQSADVAAADTDPLIHFLRFGAAEGRNPSALFDVKWYLEQNPDVTASGDNPLLHFIRYGAAEGRDPSPYFQTKWYLNRYPDVGATRVNPLRHFMEHGSEEGRSPCPGFEPLWYLERHPEVSQGFLSALAHYRAKGAALGFDPGPDFETSWYLREYPDVAEAGVNPLEHFLRWGAREGRRPYAPRASAAFLERGPSEGAQAATTELISAYASTEPDLALAGAAPLFTLPMTADLAPALADGWRRLYLSLARLPETLILVSSADDTRLHPILSSILAAANEGGDAERLLLVETDSGSPCVGAGLPRATDWRSLSEFRRDLTPEHRASITAALVHHLRPRSVLVIESEAGWSVIARHGWAISGRTRLCAALPNAAFAPIAEPSAARQHLRRHLRASFPALTSVIVADVATAEQLAQEYGLPPAVRDKLQVLAPGASGADWLAGLYAEHGFLAKRAA